MDVSRQALAGKYRLFSDEELLRLFRSGDLTDLAREVAAAELRRRRIEMREPKSEAPREEPSEPDWKPGSTAKRDLVLLARFSTSIEAHVLRSRLVAEGILAIVADDHTCEVSDFAIGGVRVLVLESHLDFARRILKAVRNGDYALDGDSDVG